MFVNVHITFDAESIPQKGRKNTLYDKHSIKTMRLLVLPHVAHKHHLHFVLTLLKCVEIHWVQSFT